MTQKEKRRPDSNLILYAISQIWMRERKENPKFRVQERNKKPKRRMTHEDQNPIGGCENILFLLLQKDFPLSVVAPRTTKPSLIYGPSCWR